MPNSYLIEANMETSMLLFFSLALFIVTLLWIRARLQMNERVRKRFDAWCERELGDSLEELRRVAEAEARAELAHWRVEVESRIREDAIRRSRAAITGKVTEHLVPYLGAFPYDPKDVRFLGAPVDLVVFDGMNLGELDEIVFVEVKTGDGAALSTRERRIRDAVREGRVRFEELRISRASDSELAPEGVPGFDP